MTHDTAKANASSDAIVSVSAPQHSRPMTSEIESGAASLARARGQAPADTIENRASWVVALAALGIMSVTLGAPFIVIVALRQISAELDSARSVVALCASLSWLGAAFGGTIMGRVAERVGAKATVIFGALMVALGLVVAASGGPVALLVGHGVFIGLLGNGAINSPLYVYVGRWFDRRLGSAIALISSGAYVAGVLWPELFQFAIADIGWRTTMLAFAAFEAVVVVPAAALLLRAPPRRELMATAAHAGGAPRRVFGKPSALITSLLLAASFTCCVTMSMPQTHLVAFCGDLGISAVTSAAMLSVLLASAFMSRQFWGWVADRMGGLQASLGASAVQAVAMTGFLITQNEAGLFFVSAVFGLGFSGIVPGYVVAIRQLYPASEAATRVPLQLFFSGMGMAFGSWSAGALYDVFGYYAPGFSLGIAFNLVNLAILGTMVRLQQRHATHGVRA
jgi:MFS family permease